MRKWSINTLGKFFTYRVAILKEHKLIQDGPYKYLIHPSYTWIILIILGQFMYTQNSIYLSGLNIIIESALLFYRIKLEERVLKEKFKGQWEEHCETKKRLISFVIKLIILENVINYLESYNTLGYIYLVIECILL